MNIKNLMWNTKLLIFTADEVEVESWTLQQQRKESEGIIVKMIKDHKYTTRR